MMEAVREWILSVVVVSMLVTLSQTLVPKGTFAGVSQLIGGLLLLITLLTPLTQVEGWVLPTGLQDYRVQIQDQQAVFAAMEQTQLELGIAQGTQAYILDKAEALGIACQVEVVTAIDDSGAVQLVEINFDVPWNEALSVYVEQTLGVGQEGQTWHENQ